MNTWCVAFAAHRLGLTYPELFALHHALDTPEHCIERVKTELIAQNFELGITCAHQSCARWSGLPVFIKHNSKWADLIVVDPQTVCHYQLEIDGLHAYEDMPPLCTLIYLFWPERLFSDGELQVDCREPKKVIKALIN